MTKAHTMITIGDFTCRVAEPIDQVRVKFYSGGETIQFTTMDDTIVIFKPRLIPTIKLKKVSGTKALKWEGVQE